MKIMSIGLYLLFLKMQVKIWLEHMGFRWKFYQPRKKQNFCLLDLFP